MASKNYRIPYDEDGNMLRYAGYGHENTRENRDWYDELEYVGYGRGRSAAYFEWKSTLNGKRYFMFMTDFDDILKNKNLVNHKVCGVWAYCKRGQNFGVKFVGKAEDVSKA